MLVPTFGLTATERVLPSVSLIFTSATLDPRIAVARAGNTATRINQTGAIEVVNANLPRFDFDPVTLVCRGLLIEETRRNLLLNTDALATQNVTVTAVAHTISFYGTGSLALSGAHTATVNGTGAYPTRTTLTFTPAAGTLTVTVTGTVQYAQLEIGAFATSYIPNAGTQNTRATDVVSMTGTNFSSWWNPSQGAFVVQAQALPNANINATLVSANDVSNNNVVAMNFEPTLNILRGQVTRLGAGQTTGQGVATISPGAVFNGAIAYKENDFCTGCNGTTVATDTSVILPTVTQLTIGTRTSAQTPFSGWIRQIFYFPQRIINSELAAFTK